MKVKLSEVLDAIEFTDQYTHYFLDKETGEIVMVSEMGMSMKEQEEAYDTLDEHGFYRLPEKREIGDYDTMESFASTVPGAAGEKLAHAIQGRGAFRRFKDEIRLLDLEDQWYSYEEDPHKRAAIAWCEENGLEWE